MSSPISHSSLAQFSTELLSKLNAYPRGAIVASLCALLAPLAIRNFRQYKALGRSGLPNVFVGWVLATLLKPVGRETTSTDEYERDANKDAWLVAGNGPRHIPSRGRQRPSTGWHFLPHRQTEHFPSEKIKKMLAAEFRSIADANTHLVEVQVSPHERLGDAMVILASRPSPHAVATTARREIAHYHELKDFSMHVTLSPQDCKLVIEQGWGERHPISGRIGLPKEYLIIYAPLTEDDVRIAGLIMRASVGYMADSKEVN
ncbi:hypothetical protein M0805_005738 [Coniferiporia weirii]|nr:hypothetical protein M0805_005738 [Coniferiporia weirii]